MRVLRALAVTAGLLAVMYVSDGGFGGGYVTATIILSTALWVAVDAAKLGLKEYQGGFGRPVLDFIVVSGVWLFLFPKYLVIRSRRVAGVLPPRETGRALQSTALPLARLAGIGLVVFLANAALLVLQIVASRLLAPFIGSDLYTWTGIIGVFLTGIALGNAYGGRIADRYPHPRTLVGLLAAGALAALWMAAFPMLLEATGAHKSIPLGPRIPVLAAVLCLPAGFVLSLLTPVSIKLGLPDVSKAGSVAGLIFSLSTLGCLLGNYVTGFYLVPLFTINTLVYVSAGLLAVTAAGVWVVLNRNPVADTPAAPEAPEVIADAPAPAAADEPPARPGFADIRHAYLVVFVASFCGMALELAASRVIAQNIGVSLFSWTGVIGVMLAGTALGNLVGGRLADRFGRAGRVADARMWLGASLVLAGGCIIVILVINPVLTQNRAFAEDGVIAQILWWTFVLFFAPMAVLGTISPQVIRLAVPDVAHAGRVAGRVYAWSTAGAIAGTFATGYVLLSGLGVQRTIIAAAAALPFLAMTVAPVWRHNVLLYLLSIVLGGVTGGLILTWNPLKSGAGEVAVRDSNYYRIRVTEEYLKADPDDEPDPELEADPETKGQGLKRLHNLYLDHLLHSTVDVRRPLYIYYKHEEIQIEFCRAAAAGGAPKVLLIGGGGYTLPRAVRTLLPETYMDVVEIDPEVTKVAYEVLGLKKSERQKDVNMDGRQYVAEVAPRGGYDLVVQDAVNDLSVPSHLMTKEYNDAVKAALKPADGVYLLTIIDSVEYGKIWRAGMATLAKTFKHVHLLASSDPPAETRPADPDGAAAYDKQLDGWAKGRQVYVIYAADKPLDLAALRRVTVAAAAPRWPLTRSAAVGAAAATPEPDFFTRLVPPKVLAPFLEREPGVILTDQYAPVDYLMAEVFRRR